MTERFMGVQPMEVHFRDCPSDRGGTCYCGIRKERKMAGSPRYLELLEAARELHIRKNAGYAGADNPDPWANFRMSEWLGISAAKSALVRLSDKYIRIQNLMQDPNNDQVGESIKDTLMDLSAYALITICLLEEEEETRGLDNPENFN